MGSPTKVRKIRKVLRKARVGKTRKNRDRNQGSTAKRLPLDKPNANERSQKSKD